MPILADHKTSELITAHEHEVLSGLLALLRDKTQWVPYFMYSLSHHAEKLADGIPLTPKLVMDEVIGAYHDEPTNLKSLSAVLMDNSPLDGSYNEIDDDEFKELSNYLKVIRAGGWLAERMSLEFDFFAEGRRYTPGEVIQHIVNFALNEFAGSVSTAKDLIRDYPRLFQEDLNALSAAVANVDPVEPAAPEAGPQRRPRKRTSGKTPLVASK